MDGANGPKLVINKPKDLPNLQISAYNILALAERTRGVMTYDSVIPGTCYIVAKDEMAVFNKESFLRIGKKELNNLIYELQNISEDMAVWLRFKD